MRISRSFQAMSVVVACSLSGVSTAHADEVFSGVAGYSSTSIPSGRDLYASIPFSAGDPFVGALTSVGDADPDDRHEIEVQGLSGMQVDDKAGSHAVRLFSGPDEGRRFPVVSNSADSLLVDFGGVAPSPGTVVAVEPCWTLGALLPSGTQTAISPSSGKFAPGRRTEVHLLAASGSGGLVSSSRIFFLDGGDWTEAGDGFDAAADVLLPFDAALFVRNPSAAPATLWSVAGVGYVGPVASRIEHSAGSEGSNAAGFLVPGGATLSEAGLEGAVRASTGVGSGDRTDVLRVFGLTRPDTVAPVANYFRTVDGWFDAAGNAPADNAALPAGSVLVIENLAPASGGRTDWNQNGGN